jgi:hypothetical protein
MLHGVAWPCEYHAVIIIIIILIIIGPKRDEVTGMEKIT